MRNIQTLALLVAVLFLPSCGLLGGPRGTIAVNAVLPTAEAMAPYTSAGIEASDLTAAQKANYLREVEVQLELLRAAAVE